MYMFIGYAGFPYIYSSLFVVMQYFHIAHCFVCSHSWPRDKTRRTERL